VFVDNLDEENDGRVLLESVYGGISPLVFPLVKGRNWFPSSVAVAKGARLIMRNVGSNAQGIWISFLYGPPETQ